MEGTTIPFLQAGPKDYLRADQLTRYVITNGTLEAPEAIQCYHTAGGPPVSILGVENCNMFRREWANVLHGNGYIAAHTHGAGGGFAG